VPGSLLTLDGCGELVIFAEPDALWITCDGSAEDRTPRAGEALHLTGTARIRISAFTPAHLRLDTCGWRWRRGVFAHADGRRERIIRPAEVPDQSLVARIGFRIAAFACWAAGRSQAGRRMPVAEGGWPP
jgi:hypothetical protein